MVMKKLIVPISFTTTVWLFYQVSPLFSPTMLWLMIMQVFITILMVWMVLRILKDGEPSQRTFEDYFYDDSDYKRNNGPLNS